ncbi:MAG: multicopper oxidase CueO [Alphaproteobacteria bacterium]|nr:multicopper oxidase CueO [Alphaproteobacteria bacterium]
MPLTLTRRQLLAGLAALPALTPAAEAAAPDLPLPPLVDLEKTGGIAAFTAQKATHQFSPGGPASESYGYSASFLGPVFKVRAGTDMKVQFRNALDVETAVHWHGLLIPSAVDGGPHNPVAPGGTWEPTLPIRQQACTAWYHPHPHGDTARQVYMGLAGLIYIEDDASAALNLPAAYGVNDFPLVLQDRDFDDQGVMVYDTSPMAVMHGARGAQVIVNGALQPQAQVAKGLNRLRLLNGANARNFQLRFADGRSFAVIASDGGLLEKPVTVATLVIAPGERYEILVDFADGKPAALQTFPDYNGDFGTGTISALKDRLAAMTHEAETILTFAPVKPAPAAKLPASLASLPAANAAEAVQTRRFLLNPMNMMNMPMMEAAGQGGMANMNHSGMMMQGMMKGMKMAMPGMDMSGLGMGMKMAINDKSFDMARIDAEPKLGSSELWELSGEAMAHPFHIHGVQFRVLELDGAAPPEEQRGWKDTVLVNQKTRLLVRFTQTATAEKPFMFHCHILEHEDAGMMAQYRTV